MKLVIHAHTLKSEPLSQAIIGHFDQRGGTIGRSDTNTLTLPDPERHVSRLQAEVVFAGQGFSIRNVGSANPIEHNGRTLRPGEGAPLAAGDQLVIGGYALRVVADAKTGTGPASPAPSVDSRTVIRSSAGEARTDPPPARAAVPAAAPAASAASAAGASARRRIEPTLPPAADPFADLMGSSSAGAPAMADPFADLLAPPASPVPAAGRAAMPAPPPSARLPPDNADPFADLAAPPKGAADSGLGDFMASTAPAPPRALDARPADSGLDDLFGLGRGSAGPAPPSLDSMFGLGGGSGSGKGGGDLLDEFIAPRKPAGAAPTGDLLDLFGEKTGNSTIEPTEPAAFNHTPELKAAYTPPPVRPAPPLVSKRPLVAAPPLVPPIVPPPVARPPIESARPRLPVAPPPLQGAAPADGPATPEALWRAFCEGSGINLQLPGGLNPQMMRVMGQLMHHAVEGTMKLMSARAAAKQELRAQVTTIQSKNNNPLKFSVDPPSALAQLLQPPMRGFMTGPDAVRDAMDDLLGHNIGTMAGTRAALQGVLKRFEPNRLEAKLTNKGVIDAVLPMNRRAKLWELYVEHYKLVQDEAQEDFHELFGKAFVKAYEQQLDRLEASRRKAG